MTHGLMPDKGLKNGSCNVTACQAPGAEYFNKSTRKYYCRRCADEINWPGGRADTMALYGTPLLCEKDEEWLPEDSEAADAEGWNLFNADVELQVQRVDEAGLLPDDTSAWSLVRHGDKPHHLKAQRMLKAKSPDEWRRIVRHT